MTDLDAIRERHYPIGIQEDRGCAADGQLWPCETAQTLLRVAKLGAALQTIAAKSEPPVLECSCDWCVVGAIARDALARAEDKA